MRSAANDANSERLHNSSAARRGERAAADDRERRCRATPIPHHYLYGRLEGDAEAVVELDFLHFQPIRKRSGANNWTIEPQTHPRHLQLLHVGKGGGVVDIEGRVLEVAPCLMAIPVGSVHRIRFHPDTDGWVALGFCEDPVVEQAGRGRAGARPAAHRRPPPGSGTTRPR